MTCLLVLTITVLGDTYTVERWYTGRLVAIEATTYKVDFSARQDWLKKPLSVKQDDCEKAD
jgi:hypothetical protein